MSSQIEKVFGKTLQTAEEWLIAVMKELGTDDPHFAYRALRATLHVLRDRLTPEEANDLAAQLPMLLRGLFFDGWVPSRTPLKRTREQFVEEVHWRAQESRPDVDAEPVVRAVLHTLSERVSRGEIDDVRHTLPASFDSLFSD